MSKKPKKKPRPQQRQRGMTREQILKAAAAHAATIDTRLKKRDDETSRIDVAMPADVLAFLDELFETPAIAVPRGMTFEDEWSFVGVLISAFRDAYRNGCRQGYVEGFVARRRPHKQGSATGNAAKRRTLVVLPDGRKMTRDDRDTLMVEEYESLLALKIKKTPAMQRLAEKYGFESWQGVAAAIESLRERSGG